MSVGSEILPLIITIITGLAFRGAAKLFSEADKLKPDVDLRIEDTRSELASRVLREMEEDIERGLGLDDPNVILGLNYVAHRRNRTARELTKSIWNKTTEHMRLERVHHHLTRWEERGRLLCAIGTSITMILLAVLFLLILTQPLPLEINKLYAWLAFVALVIPSAAVAFCYLAAYKYKQDWNLLANQSNSLT